MHKSPKNTVEKKPDTGKKIVDNEPCHIHHLAFDNAAQANIVSKVSNGKIILANAAACRLLGFSKKDVLTKCSEDIFDKKEQSFKKMLAERLIEGQSAALVTVIKKSGKSFFAQITSAVFFEDGIEKSITTIADMTQNISEQKVIDDRKEKIVADNIEIAKSKQKNIDIQKEKLVAHDIAEAQVKSEASLIENNDWLKYIGNTSCNVICDWNILTGEIFIGENFEKLFGYPIRDHKGSSADKNNYIHPDDKDAFVDGLQKAITSNSPYWENIYRFIRADGSIANVFERANIIRKADGEACRIIGVMQDISRQKQDEDGLGSLGVRKNIIAEKIKSIIIELIHYSSEQLKINFSDHLSNKLEYNYTYLANVFSEEEGISIQTYIISKKIERVKELMEDGLSLTEIAWKLHYSSVAHLSNQFKKIAGITPSVFKQQIQNRHTTLQNV